MSGSTRSTSGAVDLEQLAARESEQIEWKENVADIDDVVETLSAFANDIANLGGGYVVCGAAEHKDEHGFPKLVRVGLTAARLKEIEGKVLTRCRDKVSPPITPILEEIPSDQPDRRILVFIQPSTGQAHVARRSDAGGKHFVRVGRETIEARNGTLRELLVRKGALEPWDRRPCDGATVNDLDLLALRDALQRMRVFSSEVGLEPFLTPDVVLSPLVPSLCVRENLTGIARPRNYAMLLFGRETQKFIQGAFSLFSIYPGTDRSDVHAERHELTGTIIEQARKLSDLLDVQSYTAFDKSDARAPNAVKYPKRALYEAMGNALAHRDYEVVDPCRITVFEDRIEILSPGSLPFGVDAQAFKEGRAHPRWRNQTLAWFFNKLQIAQAEGQGIPTILRSMREEGNPPPVLSNDDVSVLCILPAHPRHALLRDMRVAEQAMALGQLDRAREISYQILIRDPLNFRALQLFAEVQTALKDPDLVAEVLNTNAIDVERLPSPVLMQLSDALNCDQGKRQKYRQLSSRLVSAASQGRLEEMELRRIAVSMMRNREDQAALTLIDRNLSDHPEWKDSASIAQLRGDAMIGLAKQCRNTATHHRLPRSARQRSWKQFHVFLEQAEAELRRAEHLSIDQGLDRIIKKNLSFIAQLRHDHAQRRS